MPLLSWGRLDEPAGRQDGRELGLMTAAKPTAAAKPADGDREPAGYPGLVWYNAGMVVAAATTMALYIIILVEGKGTLVMVIAEGKGTLVMAITEGKSSLTACHR